MPICSMLVLYILANPSIFHAFLKAKLREDLTPVPNLEVGLDIPLQNRTLRLQSVHSNVSSHSSTANRTKGL